MSISAVRAPAARASVVKGSGVLILARVIGMMSGFALFLLLTWRSRETAGIFRTAVTYFVIMDSLPLLGMQRWLAAEIARQGDRRAEIFRVSMAFAGFVALLSGVIYFVIASTGLYQPDISANLKIVSLSTVPSAVYLCVTIALIGLGHSHMSGILGLIETLARTLIAILIVISGANEIWVIVDFTVVRFVIAAAAFYLVRAYIPKTPYRWDKELVRAFLTHIPNLAVAMVGALIIRSTAMLLLPWLCGESETGIYAAPFQLFDLLLLVPTVLTISTNYVFVESAKSSPSRVRRSINGLLLITGLFVFPLAAIACVLAKPGIEFLFGPSYHGSILPFQILLVAAVVTSLDQVFSTAMVNAGNYRADRICIAIGAVVTVLLTLTLAKYLEATGAAIGLLGGITCTLAGRIRMIGNLLNPVSFVTVLRCLALPSLSAAALSWLTLWGIEATHRAAPVVTIVAPSLVGVSFVLLFCFYGGISERHFRRIRTFMAQRG